MGSSFSFTWTPNKPMAGVNYAHGKIINAADRDLRTTEVATSSTFKRYKTERENCTPISLRAEQSKASFLDLPPEIRNHIYGQLLILDDYIRPTSNIPNLRILEVCKQVHDEAASVFYAANSFYCSWGTRAIAYENVPLDMIKFPKISAPWPEGLIWPALRYHVYLTRVVIDARVDLYVLNHLQNVSDFTGQHHCALMALEKELRERLSKSHMELAELWAAKERPWHGSLSCVRPQRTAYLCSSTYLNAMIAFCEGEEEVTKNLVRRYRQLG
ncbi:hypothetical protein BU16DRAFT_341874 [Lophium mytilinum]|uniref:F-box domain-containing protein n=1 Tax=Lophium mytilinum TaxID=390894 RepID=A0A6A6QWJ0_9PEZI|nr:hypothetical protein BU16DRAFT_341874 [Lophium mytilinum]